MKMKRTKAQMEMMGLAIVVILLALGMFFLVRFMVVENPPEIKKTFTSKELASNMIGAFLKTDSGCGDRNLRMDDLIIAYVEFEDFTCEEKNITTYLEDSINYIFNKTLTKWGKSYAIKIDFPNQDDICLPKNSAGQCVTCPAGKESKLWPMPSDYGNILITMDICT